ncbi:MAG TPA: hypothetical protein VHA12_04250 [Candidatus Nanoarchaeia archaeon]|nr:hypothetical protein [Candidatus Nanoarchaeia archaeon]
MHSSVQYSKGQLKIQEMAFVLVAIFIFFGLAALFFFTVSLGNLKQSVTDLEGEQAKQLAFQLANTPEFSWSDDTCVNCIDSLKTLLLKDHKDIYLQYWNLDYLVIETTYPEKQGECTLQNYPNCRTITLANRTDYYGTPATAYVSICRHEKVSSGGSYPVCEIGLIHASMEAKT